MCGYSHHTIIQMHSFFFLIPPKPKWSQLSSHFDFGVNNQCSLYPQYHDWGEIFKQGTKPPTALRVPQHWLPTAPGVCSRCVHVCSLLCVCALGCVKCRVQILSMGHHIWPHVTSLSLNYFMSSCALYFFALSTEERWGAEIISM